MAFSLVSAPNPGFNASGASVSITIAPAVSAGALIIASAWCHGTTTIPTVSDNINAGNYTQEQTNNFFSSDPTSQNHKENSGAAGANGLTITATSSGATSIGLAVEVWTGAALTGAFDTGQTNADGTGSVNMTSNASGTVAGGNELVYGVGMSGGVTETFTAGATYTLDSQANNATVGAMGQESKVLASASGTQTATLTQLAADVYYMYVAVFKAPAVVAFVPQPVRSKLRALFKARGRVFERFWPQQPTPGPVRFILDRRLRRYPMPVPHGRRAEPFWPQQMVAPPPPLPPDTRPPRRRLLALRRGRSDALLWTPAVQPPPQTQRPRSKLLPVRRTRTDRPLAPPLPLPPAQQIRRRLVVYRRGKVAEPFWPQQPIPGPQQFILDRRLRRYPMPVPRGRHSEPPWPQAARPAAVPKLPAAIATPVTAARGTPRPTPIATPIQSPTASPRPTPIATPVQTPRIIN